MRTIRSTWPAGTTNTWESHRRQAPYEESSWQQEAGPTLFSPFPESTDYFGDRHRMWMVNFRVSDLDKMVAQLRARGIEVQLDPKNPYPNGYFAHFE